MASNEAKLTNENECNGTATIFSANPVSNVFPVFQSIRLEASSQNPKDRVRRMINRFRFRELTIFQTEEKWWEYHSPRMWRGILGRKFWEDITKEGLYLKVLNDLMSVDRHNLREQFAKFFAIQPRFSCPVGDMKTIYVYLLETGQLQHLDMQFLEEDGRIIVFGRSKFDDTFIACGANEHKALKNWLTAHSQRLYTKLRYPIRQGYMHNPKGLLDALHTHNFIRQMRHFMTTLPTNHVECILQVRFSESDTGPRFALGMGIDANSAIKAACRQFVATNVINLSFAVRLARGYSDVNGCLKTPEMPMIKPQMQPKLIPDVESQQKEWEDEEKLS